MSRGAKRVRDHVPAVNQENLACSCQKAMPPPQSGRDGRRWPAARVEPSQWVPLYFRYDPRIRFY